MISIFKTISTQLLRQPKVRAGCVSCLSNHGNWFLCPQFTTLPAVHQQPYSSLITSSIQATSEEINRKLLGHLLTLNKTPLLGDCMSPVPGVSCIPNRTLITHGEFMRRKTDREQNILKRFRRLGNGLWLRRQQGSKYKIWLKIIKHKGRRKVHKLRRSIICNSQQSRKLDRLVSSKWKKQKWYVDDPYIGYTTPSMFYYHPKMLPWNKAKMNNSEHEKNYGWRRACRGNKQRALRKHDHIGWNCSHRQKRFSPTNPNGLYNIAR